MEIKPTIEAAVKDTISVAKFIGERMVGGAFAELANIVLPHPEPNDESHIVRGAE